MVPVVRALMIHCRSRVLKGISTRLVVLSRSMALSGYMTWWVVLAPTSSSKPLVGAWFILQGHFLFLGYFFLTLFPSVFLITRHPHNFQDSLKWVLSPVWHKNGFCYINIQRSFTQRQENQAWSPLWGKKKIEEYPKSTIRPALAMFWTCKLQLRTIHCPFRAQQLLLGKLDEGSLLLCPTILKLEQ